MANPRPRTVALPPDSELAAVLAEASSSGLPLIVEAGHTSYALDVRPAESQADPSTGEPYRPSRSLSPAELYRAITERRDVRDVMRRLEVDAELREEAERLEASLRNRHPRLFDRLGRIRPAALSRLAIERAGGREVLSGDELRALEERAGPGNERPGGAP